ncbi:hypothetical protein [Phytobacter diazotrophicus]|uniref:hypothetical protein n=1 Tax=Phytobacter diazotrophicus TaxID=395631 RepID=UPI001F1F08C1|nr:hypothetical protein [Phytobacter diazotrophicus]
MKVHLITTCSAGKTTPAGETVFPYQLPAVDVALSAWRNLLRNVRTTLPAAHLYSGLHWSRALEVATRHSGLELWIISAGLGLRHATDPAVPYEATFRMMPFQGSEVWKGLTEKPPLKGRCNSLSQLMYRFPEDQFVVAASPLYLTAILQDLMQGKDNLDDANAQLTVVSSGGCPVPLLPYLTRSHAGMLAELNTNMTGLNISLASRVISRLMSPEIK